MVSNTEGVAEGVTQADAEALRSIVLPLVINVNSDFVSVVNREGLSLLTVRRAPEASAGEYETLPRGGVLRRMGANAGGAGRWQQRRRERQERRP